MNIKTKRKIKLKFKNVKTRKLKSYNQSIKINSRSVHCSYVRSDCQILRFFHTFVCKIKGHKCNQF